MKLNPLKVNLVASSGREITLEYDRLYHIRTCDTVYKGFYFSHVNYIHQELVFYNSVDEYRMPVCIPLDIIHLIWTCDDDYSQFPSECRYCRVD